MVAVRVTHAIGDLASDLRKITRAAPSEFKKVVRNNAMAGARLARESAGRQHTMNSRYDIHYPRSITWDNPKSYYGFGGGAISAEYGPDPARKQGGMSFERGSRNQPPHNDLAKSADAIGPAMAFEAGKAAADLFWPES